MSDDLAHEFDQPNPFISGRIVQRTADFDRIKALRRREWKPDQIKKVQALLTDRFVTAEGRRAGAQLLPLQGVALAEAFTQKGLFAALSVGSGKTAISFLAPAMLEAKRAMLFVKACLREKTIKDLREYRKHWHIPDFALVNYEQLSSARFADTLDRVQPDLIIADEAHALKNFKAARTRRFLRFMRASPATQFIALSGTMSRNSLRDYWSLINLALRHDVPLPIPWIDLQDWADALDANVPDHRRALPGVLVELCPAALRTDDMPALTVARTGFQNRLRVTPGVVITTSGSCDCSLVLQKRELDVPPAIEAALGDLRASWETPNGDYIEWALEHYRIAREIASGFYSRWEPPAPAHWMEPRRDWHRFVRDVLKENEPGLDSPLQVARAFKGDPIYIKWRNVRDTFMPNSVPNWIHDYVVRDAVEWLAEHKQIVWVEHPCVGAAIGNAAGVPYFGAGADASRAIIGHKGACVASIASHGTGKNLQHYNRALLTSCPPSASVIEQLIGRLHRMGQSADDVTFDINLQVPEMSDSFAKAVTEAQFIFETTGDRQKLLYADKIGF